MTEAAVDSPPVSELNDAPSVPATNDDPPVPTPEEGAAGPLEEQNNFFNITVVTPTGSNIKLQISTADNVQDIKQMLFEAKEICHITSYILLFQGTEVNGFADLKDIEGLEEGSVFTMQECPYSQFDSRLHVRKLRELLSNTTEKPFSLLSSLTTKLEKECAEAAKQKEKQITHAPKPKNQKNKGRKNRKNRKNKKQKQQQAVDRPEPSTIFSLNEQDQGLETFFPPRNTKTECVHSISYSGWNPPPGFRQCKGDLAYLVIRTLENKTFHVTSASNGFFVNNSSGSTFDPTPAKNSFFAHTLVEVLQNISPLFKTNFKTLLDEYFVSHPFEVISVPHEELNLPWLDADAPHTFDLNRTEAFLSGEEVFQFPDQLRDWNAEFQSCKELPKETLQERIFRDRAIIKITNEFVIGAIVGAKAIANGAVHPINPTDPRPAHLYIHDNIFFSHAMNGRFLFDEGEMGPYKCANNDLKGVMAFNLIDIPEIHTVLTVLVNYRGNRIVAQSIIPGILHQTNVDCIRYGSVDHGKNLVWDEDFHDTMKKAAELLRIPEHEIEDESGKRMKLCCSVETKGVLGTDGRKYVLDLDRTSVRDSNFEDSWALLRLELYDVFTEWKKHHHVLKYKEQYDKLARRRVEKAKEEQEKSEEATKDEGTTTEKETEEDEEPINIPEFVPPIFNPNATDLKHVKLVGDEESIKEAEAQVKELGDFLMNYVIPLLANEIRNNMAYPSDSVSLAKFFHSRGVNLRYLGYVVKLLNNSKPFIKDLMIREMIVRSTKHILHAFLQTLGEAQTSEGISHFLNCFIRGAFMRNFNHPSGIPCESHVPEQFGLTPTKLWDSIDEKVKAQFHYELQKEEFQASEYALPALRLLCQKTGISIRAKQYDLYAHQPITSDDIMGLFPIIKMPTPANSDAWDLVEAGKNFLMKGRVDVAFEFLTEAIQIFHQTHGPIHPNTAQCYSHLAMVLSHVGDYAQAIIHQSKAIIILERTKGLDHSETAFEYGNLGLFYHQAQHYQIAYGFLQRSLYLSTIIGGSKYPDNAATLTNIAAILQDNMEFEKAIDYYTKAISCFDYHYGAKHSNIASAHHNIALCYAHLKNFRMALQNERKTQEIFNEILGPQDPRTTESNNFIDQFTSQAVEVEKESKMSQKVNSVPNPNRGTDDSIGTLPIRDIMKYINNNEASKVRSFRK